MPLSQLSDRKTRSASAATEQFSFSENRDPEGESTPMITNNDLLLNAEKALFSPDEVKDMIEKAVRAATLQFEIAYTEKLRYMKAEMLELRDTVHKLQVSHNRLEQYSRRSNLRIRGLQIPKGADCREKVVNFINDNVKTTDGQSLRITANDIDAAHPLPSRPKKTAAETIPKAADEATARTAAQTDPDVVIVRFHERDTRDAIIRARRSLKGSAMTIQEDLTRANAALLYRLSKVQAITSAWSWEGKIYGLVNGIKKPQRYDIHDEL